MHDVTAVRSMEEGKMAHGGDGQGGNLVSDGQNGEGLEGVREEEDASSLEGSDISDDDSDNEEEGEEEEEDDNVCTFCKACIGNPEQFFSRFGSIVALLGTCLTSVTNLLASLASADWTAVILNCVFLGVIQGPTTCALLYFFFKQPVKAIMKLVAKCVAMRVEHKRRQAEKLLKYMEGKINTALDTSDEHKTTQANGTLKHHGVQGIPDAYHQDIGERHENMENSMQQISTHNQLMRQSHNQSHNRLSHNVRSSSEIVLDPSKYTSTITDTGSGLTGQKGAASVLRFSLPQGDIHTTEPSLSESNSQAVKTVKEGGLRGILKKRRRNNHETKHPSSVSIYDDTSSNHKEQHPVNGSVTEISDKGRGLTKSFHENTVNDGHHEDKIQGVQNTKAEVEVKDEMVASVGFSQTSKASNRRKRRATTTQQQNGVSSGKRHLPNTPEVNETGSGITAENPTRARLDLTEDIQTIDREATGREGESSLPPNRPGRQNRRRAGFPFSAKFYYVMRHVCWQ